ncbi:hypothetical protein BOX15_Mlig005666g3 [Macrostomum lignano]|uniref:EMI domain-containing protein n=1 Tax=Macrostomum lignano TaxID=282301 RepID=A0A267G5P9_9PLAT|nr:hypothetical protein BOX15_Mlig005666g3 [Macrostomum lignano]
MSSSWTVSILVVATALAVHLLEPSEAHSVNRVHKVFACQRPMRMIAFKKIGGIPKVALLQYKLIDDHCEKVQTVPRSTDDFYVTQDCRRCERSSSGRWSCSKIRDQAEGADKKSNCRSVLGPDCRPYLVSKNDDEKPCV